MPHIMYTESPIQAPPGHFSCTRYLTLRHPPSNDGVGDASHQQADREAEEHADGDIAEVVGGHHDAAEGDEEGPDEDAPAI